jgi:hypothetical protein
MEAAGEGVPVGKGLGLNPIVADQISSKANQMEAPGAQQGINNQNQHSVKSESIDLC